jgi:hypothetical protein
MKCDNGEFLLSWKQESTHSLTLKMSMSGRAVTALCTLSLVNFLENYMRTLISVSIIPFLDYDSYDYSLLSGE